MTLRITRIGLDFDGPKVEIDLTLAPEANTWSGRDVTKAADLPSQVREALLRWLTETNEETPQ